LLNRTFKVDALSKILELIKFKGVVYRKLEVKTPWGIDLPNSQFLQFWKLLEGTCFLQVENDIIIELGKGDLVIINNGQNIGFQTDLIA
jgi:hypothetical protein